MRQIKATIVGMSPLLQNNPAAMKKTRGGSTRIPPPDEEAAGACYWTADKSSLALPSTHIHGSLIAASARYKVGKKTAWSLVASVMHISPELIPLGTKTYDIDVRGAVVQRQRVWRARPKIEPWSASFLIDFDEEWLSLAFMSETMIEIFAAAGATVGVSDFRPQKRGPFGTFRLDRYELMKPDASAAKRTPPKLVGFEKKAA